MRAAFRGAVHLAQVDAMEFGAVHKTRRNGSTAAQPQIQRLKLRTVVEFDALQDVVDKRRGSHGPRAAFAVHQLDSLARRELLHQHAATATKHRGNKTMPETNGVVERRAVEHDIVFGATSFADENALRVQHVVMRQQCGLRLAGGAGRRQDNDDIVRGYLGHAV